MENLTEMIFAQELSDPFVLQSVGRAFLFTTKTELALVRRGYNWSIVQLYQHVFVTCLDTGVTSITLVVIYFYLHFTLSRSV